MKKEGTGEPRNPAIAFGANVEMRELRFEEVPSPEVSFRGNTGRNSVWASSRENLSRDVREGIVYRESTVQLRIASEIINSDPDFQNKLDIERVGSKPEDGECKRREQETTNTEETA